MVNQKQKGKEYEKIMFVTVQTLNWKAVRNPESDKSKLDRTNNVDRTCPILCNKIGEYSNVLTEK